MRLRSGHRPGPAGGAKALPQTPSRNKGPTSKGRGREGRGEEGKRGGKEGVLLLREGKRKGGEGRGRGRWEAPSEILNTPLAVSDGGVVTNYIHSQYNTK